MIEQNRSQALTSSQGRVLMSIHANTDTYIVMLSSNTVLTTLFSQHLLLYYRFDKVDTSQFVSIAAVPYDMITL